MTELFFSEEDYYAAQDGDRCATQGEAVAEYARNVGADRPDQEYILSHYDTWERNPFFTGTPGRHPEDDQDDDAPLASDDDGFPGECTPFYNDEMPF